MVYCSFACGRVVLTSTWDPVSLRMFSTPIKTLGYINRLNTSITLRRAVEASILINEPNITARRAVCRMDWQWTAGTTGAGMILSLNGEADATYSIPAAARTALGGGSVLQRRFPSDANLARGYNTLNCSVYNATAAAEGIISRGMLVYEHDTPSAGWWAAPQNIDRWFLSTVTSNTNGNLYGNVTILNTAAIADNYYIDSLHLDVNLPFVASALGVTIDNTLVGAEGVGLVQYPAFLLVAPAEIGVKETIIPIRQGFARWPGDAKPVNDVQADCIPHVARSVGVAFTTGFVFDMNVVACIRHQPFTVSGTLTGYTGDGSGIPVSVYEASSRQILRMTTTAIGGTFSVPWHDDTATVFVTAKQDATRHDRSDDFLPGTPVTLDLSPAGAGPSITSITMGAL